MIYLRGLRGHVAVCVHMCMLTPVFVACCIYCLVYIVAGKRAAAAVQQVMDAVSRLPRLFSPGCAVLKQGLSHFLQAQKGSD